MLSWEGSSKSSAEQSKDEDVNSQCEDGPVVYPADAFDSRLRGD